MIAPLFRKRMIISMSKRETGSLTEYLAVADDGTIWKIANVGITRTEFTEWEYVALPPLPDAQI